MNNGIFRTTMLLSLLTGMFIFIGSAIGGTGGMVIAFIFAIVMNMGAWWFSGTMALRFSGAREVTPEEAPELHHMVESLAQRAEMPKPKVCMIDSDVPNAFATGRNPQNGAVAVTTGIMALLDRDELAGVVAHELAHIKHYDTLISSIAATIGGAITMLAELAMWGMIFGGLSGDEDDDGGLADMVGGILMIILAPIAAMIVQMAISRSREFSADAGGARILGDPLPLASALERLEQLHQAPQVAEQEQVNPATSHMYIINPLRGGMAGLFRTHPDTGERIKRLRELDRNPSAMAA